MQKEIKAVYLWETKVRPTAPAIEEKIVLKIRANNQWWVPIPVAWYTASSSYWAPYNWYYQVDDWAKYTASWTSRSGGYFWALTWATPWSDHIVTITPVTEGYWWARAFSFNSTWVESLLQEIIYDSSYMGYAVSETSTWNSFRDYQYFWCSSLTTPPEEYLPNTVTTIWNHYRRRQFMSCTSLTKSAVEELPSSVTTIWTNFRSQQYSTCSALSEIPWWVDLSVWWANYRYQQYYQSTASKTVKVLSNVWYASYDALTLQYWPVTQVQVPSAYLSNFKSSTINPRVNIPDDRYVWY